MAAVQSDYAFVMTRLSIFLLLLIISSVASSVVAVDIFDAVNLDDPSAIQASLLEEAEESRANNLNRRGAGGQTPLMSAVLRGKFRAVEELLKQGADVTIGEKDGYTPMHGAGFQGRAEIAKLLIQHGLDPSDRHRDGYTPIHRACWGREQRHTDTVKALLEAGVSPKEAASDGRTPIEMTQNPYTRELLEGWMKDKEAEL